MGGIYKYERVVCRLYGSRVCWSGDLVKYAAGIYKCIRGADLDQIIR